MLGQRRLRRVSHGGARLGPEVLDDDLLQMIVAGMQGAQREQGFDALAPRLADADQDAAGERHAELAGRADRLQANPGMLVRAAVVGAAARTGAPRSIPASARRKPKPAQQLEVRPGHHAGIDVRQQSGRVVNPLRDLREIEMVVS